MCMCTTCFCTRQLHEHAHFTTCANPPSPHAQCDAHQLRRIGVRVDGVRCIASSAPHAGG
eukprot:5763529-Pleurochrysis_carterae.AAC.1